MFPPGSPLGLAGDGSWEGGVVVGGGLGMAFVCCVCVEFAPFPSQPGGRKGRGLKVSYGWFVGSSGPLGPDLPPSPYHILPPHVPGRMEAKPQHPQRLHPLDAVLCRLSLTTAKPAVEFCRQPIRKTCTNTLRRAFSAMSSVRPPDGDACCHACPSCGCFPVCCRPWACSSGPPSSTA